MKSKFTKYKSRGFGYYYTKRQAAKKIRKMKLF